MLFLEMRGALLLIENLCTNYLVLSLSRWSVSMPQLYLPFFFFFFCSLELYTSGLNPHLLFLYLQAVKQKTLNNCVVPLLV